MLIQFFIDNFINFNYIITTLSHTKTLKISSNMILEYIKQTCKYGIFVRIIFNI